MSDNTQQLNDFLQAFDADPCSVMERTPQKFDQNGKPLPPRSIFSSTAIANKTYVDARDRVRQQIQETDEETRTRAAYEAHDRAENLVDKFAYSTLKVMENAGLRSAKLAESPWSDDYWGIYSGILGARYADPQFPQAANWKQNYDYIRTHSASDIVKTGNTTAINRLSPSEKYDLLVGDANGTLTRRMWADGKALYDANGHVETWMGICHGWAIAAYMMPRPRKAVVVQAPNGIKITFYPSDIKALASLLWANAMPATRFIGGRCNDANPAKDPATGRLISSKCFDTNPGTWHLAIVNQLGASKRSLVMDVTYDYEVWNQPVYSYEYSYFNPKSRTASNLANAIVSRSAFTNDKFKAFRSSRAASIVGIDMRVGYVVETRPSQRPNDVPSNDEIQYVNYRYDVELDANGRIIGGEWYTNKHPDFLWTAPKNVRAVTRYDHLATGIWQAGNPLPKTWQSAAPQASQANSAPLAAIVERLIYFANS